MTEQTSLISDAEDRALRARSTQTKFKQQLFLGVGGAMVFGLVGAIAHSLIPLAWTSTGIALAPMAGLVAIAAIGLGCLYAGSRFLAEAISFDQDMQARKIEAARSKEKAVDITPEIEMTKVTSTPLGLQSQLASRGSADSPDTTINSIALHEKLQSQQLSEARA